MFLVIVLFVNSVTEMTGWRHISIMHEYAIQNSLKNLFSDNIMDHQNIHNAT